MTNFKLEAPWYTYNKMVAKLFETDREVEVSEVIPGNDGGYSMTVVVSDHDKYIALDRVMPKKVEFGNITLNIVVKSSESNNAIEDYVELYKTVFKGNMLVKDFKVATDFSGFTHCFVRFWPEVVQFFNDNTADYNGNWSGLAQDIAKEVFADCPAGIHFCTADHRENVEAVDDGSGSLMD